MKIDPELVKYLTKDDVRVLTSVEMGMRNHELVPASLIEGIAQLKRANTYKVLMHLLKHKLVMHKAGKFDGYALTYSGYDTLALNVFLKRGNITALGPKIGVGKESDVYLCQDAEGNELVVKLARLGRTSFRTVNNHLIFLRSRKTATTLRTGRATAGSTSLVSPPSRSLPSCRHYTRAGFERRALSIIIATLC